VYSKARHRDKRSLAARRNACPTAWAWLRRSVGEDGFAHNVKVLDVLERQTEEGRWPWQGECLAPYAGTMHMDNCPF
jgi:hypothetical protein